MAHTKNKYVHTCCPSNGYQINHRVPSLFTITSNSQTSTFTEQYSEYEERPHYHKFRHESNGHHFNKNIPKPPPLPSYVNETRTCKTIPPEIKNNFPKKMYEPPEPKSKASSVCPVHSKSISSKADINKLEENYWAQWKPNRSPDEPRKICRIPSALRNISPFTATTAASRKACRITSDVARIPVPNINLGNYVQCKKCLKFREKNPKRLRFNCDDGCSSYVDECTTEYSETDTQTDDVNFCDCGEKHDTSENIETTTAEVKSKESLEKKSTAEINNQYRGFNGRESGYVDGDHVEQEMLNNPNGNIANVVTCSPLSNNLDKECVVLYNQNFSDPYREFNSGNSESLSSNGFNNGELYHDNKHFEINGYGDENHHEYEYKEEEDQYYGNGDKYGYGGKENENVGSSENNRYSNSKEINDGKRGYGCKENESSENKSSDTNNMDYNYGEEIGEEGAVDKNYSNQSNGRSQNNSSKQFSNSAQNASSENANSKDSVKKNCGGSENQNLIRYGNQPNNSDDQNINRYGSNNENQNGNNNDPYGNYIDDQNLQRYGNNNDAQNVNGYGSNDNRYGNNSDAQNINSYGSNDNRYGNNSDAQNVNRYGNYSDAQNVNRYGNNSDAQSGNRYGNIDNENVNGYGNNNNVNQNINNTENINMNPSGNNVIQNISDNRYGSQNVAKRTLSPTNRDVNSNRLSTDTKPSHVYSINSIAAPRALKGHSYPLKPVAKKEKKGTGMSRSASKNVYKFKK